MTLFSVSADELDLQSTAHIRLSYMPQDSLRNYLEYHRSWFSNKYDKKSNRTYYGILDSYRNGKWSMQRENNYTFYTANKGLVLPFVCEPNSKDATCHISLLISYDSIKYIQIDQS